ncbi:MAG: aminotransferase class I/II-fold pyridoxal phosphate-dependent enzyme, partial [Gammaproteobacteria bacterium]
ALRLAQTETWRREKLHALIARFRSGATQLKLPLMNSPTAIQPLLIGDAARAMTVSDALRAAGILAIAIRPPTVPNNSARLRITLSAAHTEEHIDRLLEALDRTVSKRD